MFKLNGKQVSAQAAYDFLLKLVDQEFAANLVAHANHIAKADMLDVSEGCLAYEPV